MRLWGSDSFPLQDQRLRRERKQSGAKELHLSLLNISNVLVFGSAPASFASHEADIGRLGGAWNVRLTAQEELTNFPRRRIGRSLW